MNGVETFKEGKITQWLKKRISRVSQIYFFAGILMDFEENRAAWRNFLSTNMLERLNKEIHSDSVEHFSFIY